MYFPCFHFGNIHFTNLLRYFAVFYNSAIQATRLARSLDRHTTYRYQKRWPYSYKQDKPISFSICDFYFCTILIILPGT